MRDEKGFVLVSALAVVALLLALGGTAMVMSQVGYLTVGSERKYQLANWAADYAVNSGVLYTVDNAACPPSTSGTVGSGFNQASYTYFSIPADAYCLVHGKGTMGGGTSVVKTVIVPRTGAWGGLVTRGGTINLTGSSVIAGCDTADTSSCGVMPGVISAAALGGDHGTDPTTSCANNPSGGLVGSPPLVIDTTMGDLIARYFNVTDSNSNGSYWDDLQNALSTKYGKDVSGLTTAGTDTTPACQISCTSSPCTATLPSSPACTSAFIGCSGACNTSTTLITVQGTTSNTTVVSNGHLLFDNNVSNTNVFANNVTFDLSGDTIAGGSAGGTIYAANNINITGSGNRTIGTTADPLIFLAGQNFSAGGTGDCPITGLVVTNGTTMSISGNVSITGGIINNSTGVTMSNTGNGDIKFNMGVLKEVFNQFGDPLKRPTCGGGNIFSTVQNTKMIVF